MSPPAHDESFFYIRYPTGNKKSLDQSGNTTTSTTITSTNITTTTTYSVSELKNSKNNYKDAKGSVGSSGASSGFIRNALIKSGGSFTKESPTGDPAHDFDPDLPENPPVDLSRECKKYLSGLENGEFKANTISFFSVSHFLIVF